MPPKASEADEDRLVGTGLGGEVVGVLSSVDGALLGWLDSRPLPVQAHLAGQAR